MKNSARADAGMVPVGRISGLYGVRGWVRLYAYTKPTKALLSYQPWFIGSGYREWRLLEGRQQGKGLVGRLDGISDRDQAVALVGEEIFIRRDQLPPSGPNEFYWIDLMGLRVVNQDDVDFGVVDHLLATGSNDVLVIEGERQRLVPFVLEKTVLKVDLEQGFIQVDWDADF